MRVSRRRVVSITDSRGEKPLFIYFNIITLTRYKTRPYEEIALFYYHRTIKNYNFITYFAITFSYISYNCKV